MWIRFLMTILALVGIAIALQCYSCDDYIKCERPNTVTCPPHSKCYTLGEKANVTAKGCARSCFDVLKVGSQYRCQTCDHKDFCNKKKDFKEEEIDYSES